MFIAAVEGMAVLSARVEGAHCVAAISSRPALLSSGRDGPRRRHSSHSSQQSSIDAPEMSDVAQKDGTLRATYSTRNPSTFFKKVGLLL